MKYSVVVRQTVEYFYEVEADSTWEASMIVDGMEPKFTNIVDSDIDVDEDE